MFGRSKKALRDRWGKACAIVVAAGQSSRMGSAGNKQLIELWGKPVLAYTLEALERADAVDDIITVVREQDILFVYDLIRAHGITKSSAVVPGGSSRAQSVQNGLAMVQEADIILVHDGARPCVTPDQIRRTVEAAWAYGAALLGCPSTDTLKQVNDSGFVAGTVDRSRIWRAQTPQAFRAEVLRQAYANAEGVDATDDCALVEEMGHPVFMVQGSPDNLKITTPEDIAHAKAILQEVNQ